MDFREGIFFSLKERKEKFFFFVFAFSSYVNMPALRSELFLHLFLIMIYVLGSTKGSGARGEATRLDQTVHRIKRIGTEEPNFHLPVMNVTYVAGTTAILPCSVEHLGSYSIVWANPKATTVTLQDRRITDDSRISVERPTTTSWNLHIRDVDPSDGGIYSCHINTAPVKVKRINLIVQLPPKIIDHLSSSDINVKEGETVSLVCNVTGIPQPTVTWYRQRRHDSGVREQVGPPGEVLIIHNVTRYCDDIYTCVANNGVPPNSYRKVAVTVLFPPDVRLPIKRMGQVRGKETILDCMITAVPLGIMVWKKDGRELKKSWKYRIEPYDESGNTYTLSIRIIDLDENDFGEYTCVAANVLGKDEETMILYDATIEKEISTPKSIGKGHSNNGELQNNKSQVKIDPYQHQHTNAKPQETPLNPPTYNKGPNHPDNSALANRSTVGKRLDVYAGLLNLLMCALIMSRK